MAGWQDWKDKKVYIILKNQRIYSGLVIEVDDSSNPLIWITIIDKFNKRITFLTNEIEIIQEEENENSKTTAK